MYYIIRKRMYTLVMKSDTIINNHYNHHLNPINYVGTTLKLEIEVGMEKIELHKANAKQI